MKWKRDSKYSEVSGCGQFRVTAYKVRGKWLFQAIRLGTPSTVLLQATDAASCKAACSEIFRAGGQAK